MTQVKDMRDSIYTLILVNRMSSADTIADEVTAVLTTAVKATYVETLRLVANLLEGTFDGEVKLTPPPAGAAPAYLRSLADAAE